MWSYVIIIIFSALAVYFTFEEYRKGKCPKRTLNLIGALEAVVIGVSAVMLIRDLGV
jgi:hypothetical protein